MKIASLVLLSVFVASAASGATLSVPGTYATIQACVNAAQPGDTCLVGAGSYAGAKMVRSGTAGNRITLLADTTGTQPILTSSINVGTYDYITVQGFHFVEATVTSSEGSTYIAVIGNTFDKSSGVILALDSDHVLIDGNTFGVDAENDMVNQWGNYWVIRNNIAVNINKTSGEHLDFWQTHCGNPDPGTHTLIENNLYANITGSSVHFWLIHPTDNCLYDETNYIIRYNKVRAGGNTFVAVDDTSTTVNVGRMAVYNNVIGSMGSGYQVLTPFEITDHTALVVNNIAYESMTSSGARFLTDTNIPLRNNLVYNPGRTVTTSGPLSACVSGGGCIINQDPLFTDYDGNDFSLRAGSPAIDAGGALTAVAAADTGSGTTLVVAAAYPFQDGWAGVQADTIAVGSVSNTVQIASINYSTNTITLASAITRRDGDPVFLFRDSDGTQVLHGNAPDIGAVESTTYTGTPSAPANVKIVR